MSEKILSLDDIQKIVRPLAEKYHISEVYIFGYYATNEATENISNRLLTIIIRANKPIKETSIEP